MAAGTNMIYFKGLFSKHFKSEKRRASGDIELLRQSPLLDPVWYRQTYADLRDTPIDVARHYLEHGAAEGRNPSALFDTKFYLQQNPDVAAAGMNPLVHYISHGANEGRDPHPMFDTKWYLEQVPTLQNSGVNPLTHYLNEGYRQGLCPHPKLKNQPYSDDPNFLAAHLNAPRHTSHFGKAGTRDGINEAGQPLKPPVSDTFALSRTPLVSIIITNMNGAVHLPDLFASLKAQTYKNFEIVFVDDNSSDGSAELAQRLGADKVAITQETVGFAKANNIGLAKSQGELIALLNNDTRVDPNWLETLVSEISRDSSVCAVAPKIRFWQHFQRLRFQACAKFSLCRSALVESLGYKKLFVRIGSDNKTQIDAISIDGIFAIEIDLPVQNTPYIFSVSSDSPQALSLKIDSVWDNLLITTGPTVFPIALNETAKRGGFFVINNAGSIEPQPLKPQDRGFGEPDDCQYNKTEDVDLFCGCSVLIRRDALHDRDLFIGEFIAYYEDSELSKWLRLRGYRIRYCPTSIVYHRHSATNVEKSLFWLTHTFKNSIAFEYIFSDPSTRPDILERGKSFLNHLKEYYPKSAASSSTELEFAAAIPRVCADLDELISLIDRGEAPHRNAPKIGLYNSFWNTLGGGEAHALDIADTLCKFGQVELISEENFDLPSICSYFNIALSNARKRIVSSMDTAVTAEYDIFVNARYQSQLISKAKQSFFIVSFPSKDAPQAFLNSYHFLANSEFTIDWMKRYWGEGRFTGEVLYPAIPPAMTLDPDHPPEKKKLILSVGRFAAHGHTKNQLEIAVAFRRLCELYPQATRDWMLVLIGSGGDENYISQVQSMIDGMNARIILNASFDVVRTYYQSAAIYVHASGYGRSTDEPHLFEHFGMAVAQALGSGCLPIVYAAAGPEEIVRVSGAGLVFTTLEDLMKKLQDILPTFDDQLGTPDSVKLLAEKASVFSKRRQISRVEKLLKSRKLSANSTEAFRQT